MNTLPEMLSYYGSQVSNTLYYEVLDLPLPELEQLKTVRVSLQLLSIELCQLPVRKHTLRSHLVWCQFCGRAACPGAFNHFGHVKSPFAAPLSGLRDDVRAGPFGLIPGGW